MTYYESDEETPLLIKQDIPPRPIETPLQWGQLLVLLVTLICEPLASQSIYPFITQLISELDITGGDEKKVGYYAGIIESLFFATQACTVLQWSRLSDRIGRKPVLLTGLFGLCLSVVCFGLSRSFWSLVISRCICGMLNGNIGVMKSAVGELTDSTNRARGFSLIPIVWSVGSTIAPIIGGSLAKPYEHFPETFKSPFWREFPYLLPCAVAASIMLVCFFFCLVFLKEASFTFTASEGRILTNCRLSATIHLPLDKDAPVPIKGLLHSRVLLPIFNYVVLAFLEIALLALQPLFYSMPFELGGLALRPRTIGYVLGAFGATNGIFQFFLFPSIVGRFTPKPVFIAGIVLFIPIFCLFPVMNTLARSGAPAIYVWIVLIIQLGMCVVMDMSYSCIFMFITAAAPNRRSLGATNGLSQTTVSVARAIGPAMTTSLYSFSVQYHFLGGKLVYVILMVLTLFALALAKKLPEDGWKDRCETLEPLSD
ncbi:MFS general substrate transporter [Pleurotus eryngii]|uniref:MFS general substrate transporter n=1 Tax=Pleurotus eryngii TaxID=5323 RepID=A0A9P6DA32_PLEER|nr:MFS general substrate transporter [Pleurotus eryngii]